MNTAAFAIQHEYDVRAHICAPIRQIQYKCTLIRNPDRDIVRRYRVRAGISTPNEMDQGRELHQQNYSELCALLMPLISVHLNAHVNSCLTDLRTTRNKNKQCTKQFSVEVQCEQQLASQ